MHRLYISFGAIPISVGPIADHNASALCGRAFGDATLVSRWVLYNIKLIGKCGGCCGENCKTGEQRLG
jgi:hypothetical protein